jgi:hypothetical protein
MTDRSHLAILLLSAGAALAQPQVVLSPQAVKRGGSVAVTTSVLQAEELNDSQVTVGGSRLTPEPRPNSLVITVPATQPLGPATVTIIHNGKVYTAVDPLQVLAQDAPPSIDALRVSKAINHRIAIDIYGHGFSTDVVAQPGDIELLVDHTSRQVNWVPRPQARAEKDPFQAKCDEAANRDLNTPAALVPIYGSVISQYQIRVCNVRAENGVLPIGLRQGGDVPAAATALSVVVTDWNTDLVRAISGGVAILLVAFVYFLASFKGAHIVKNRSYRLKAMFLDKQTNTYSLSILQFHLWTAATLFGYSYFALSKLFVQRGDIIADVPDGVPGLVGIGIGAGTAVTAQLIQSVNPKGAGEEAPSPSDLVSSGGAIAPDRVQMLVWTFIAVGMFLAAVFSQDPAKISGLPTIPSTLMQLMGLSSLGYLGGKFARKPGPNILELSIIPAAAVPAGGALTTVAPVDVTAPKTKANDTANALTKIAAGLTAASAPAAVREANSAVTALQSAVAAAAGAGSAGIATLIQLSDTAHNAAVNAAAEFERAGGTPGSEIARVSANVAQRAAAAAQDLAESVASIVSAAQSTAAQRATEEAQSFRRTIEIRGSNLSAEGIFRAKVKDQDYDIPFRMLEEKDGVRAPVIVVPEENSGNAKFARTLQLNIVPATLDPVDRKTYDAVFGTANSDVILTIFNPDGQKATKSFGIPPGEAQRQ